MKSLDFADKRFLIKLFRSNNTEINPECRRYFQFNLPGELIEKKKTKLEENYNRCVLVLRDICVRLGLVLIKFIMDARSAQLERSPLYFANVFLIFFYGRLILRPWLTEVRENFTRGRP